jgi:uncharacterized Zn-binding protein involved in type VI secretion
MTPIRSSRCRAIRIDIVTIGRRYIMRGVIRLNDATSHGGKVLSAASKSKVMGIAVARKGDHCSCPIRGHHNCVIAEGDPKVQVGGIPVAFEGHKTSCGAVLISSVPMSCRV